MPEPLAIDADEFTYRVATRIGITLEAVAQHMETPEVDATRAEAIISHAAACDDYDLMAAWRVAAGIAAVARMTPAQVRELADLVGVQVDPQQQ